MTQGQYPSISTGLGNLTPDLWKRLMAMLKSYESAKEQAKQIQDNEIFFLAKITGAKNVKANSNIYKYKWTKVTISGVHSDGNLEFANTGFTSTVDGDDYANGAWNIIEAKNTSTKTSTGVNEGGSGFPSGMVLQCIGGGYDDTLGDTIVPALETVVIMLKSNNRYLFSATNSYDGSC
jgi:hypothetical protein